MSTKRIKKEASPRQSRLSKSQLNTLVEQALVDAYGESEQATAFYTMLDNDLRLPLDHASYCPLIHEMSSNRFG